MTEQAYEERLNVSLGYFSSSAISRIAFSNRMQRKYEQNRFYICMSMGNIWKEVRFPCKPTSKQIRNAVKAFKHYCAKLNAEFKAYCDADESGELDG